MASGPALLCHKNFSINLNHRLGSGIFGLVYLGEDVSTGKDSSTRKKVSAKHLPFTSVEMAQYEIINMKRASNHVNLVKIIDNFVERNSPWIIMEYCGGPTLNGYMEKVPNIQKRIKIVYQATDAIHHLHTLSPPMTHRDVKPENIIITPGPLVKIVDFGLAKTIERSGSKNASYCGGTETYMPPELFLNKDYYDALKADIFSLGIVFIGIITCAEDGNMTAFFTLVPGKPVGKMMYERRLCKEPVNVLRQKILAFRHPIPHVKILMTFLSQMVAYTPLDRVNILETMDLIEDVYQNVSANCETLASDCADENQTEPETSESSEESTSSQPDVRPKEPRQAQGSKGSSTMSPTAPLVSKDNNMSTKVIDLNALVEDWAWSSFHRSTAVSRRLKKLLEKKHISMELDWKRVQFVHDAPKYEPEMDDSAMVVTSNELFYQSFKNIADHPQHFIFKTSETTKNSFEVKIEDCFTQGVDTSITMKTPWIFEAKVGYSREMELKKSEGQCIEKEMTWSVETPLEVKGKHRGEAKLAILEEEYRGEFVIRSTIKGRVRAVFTNIKDNNSCFDVEENIDEIVKQAREDGRVKGDAMVVDETTRSVLCRAKGSCKFKYGHRQEIEYDEFPLDGAKK